jgi:hypothetical protein
MVVEVALDHYCEGLYACACRVSQALKETWPTCLPNSCDVIAVCEERFNME